MSKVVVFRIFCLSIVAAVLVVSYLRADGSFFVRSFDVFFLSWFELFGKVEIVVLAFAIDFQLKNEGQAELGLLYFLYWSLLALVATGVIAYSNNCDYFSLNVGCLKSDSKYKDLVEIPDLR